MLIKTRSKMNENRLHRKEKRNERIPCPQNSFSTSAKCKSNQSSLTLRLSLFIDMSHQETINFIIDFGKIVFA